MKPTFDTKRQVAKPVINDFNIGFSWVQDQPDFGTQDTGDPTNDVKDAKGNILAVAPTFHLHLVITLSVRCGDEAHKADEFDYSKIAQLTEVLVNAGDPFGGAIVYSQGWGDGLVVDGERIKDFSVANFPSGKIVSSAGWGNKQKTCDVTVTCGAELFGRLVSLRSQADLSPELPTNQFFYKSIRKASKSKTFVIDPPPQFADAGPFKDSLHPEKAKK